MDYKVVTKCRVCDSTGLKEYLDFGLVPLANSLLYSFDSVSKVAPINVLFCEDCALSQLSVVVNPRIMYLDYPYHSSVSETFRKHCRGMAKTVSKMLKSPIRTTSVVDIASNDGCLLEAFKETGFGHCVGVEPSKNLAQVSLKKGFITLNEFWRPGLIEGRFDVVTATNVLAHVDDVVGFVSSIKEILGEICVIEVPYAYELLHNSQFDTIYHEHLSYFMFKSLKKLFEKCGLEIFKVERIDIHGGSLRIYASHPGQYPVHPSVKALEKFENSKKVQYFITHIQYAKKINKARTEIRALIDNTAGLIAGYGAAAKGISLMNYCGISWPQVQFIVDDTPYKQGKYTPGSRIQIVSSKHFEKSKPDYIFLLPWNFKKELMAKTKKYGAKYIVAIPKAKIL